MAAEASARSRAFVVSPCLRSSSASSVSNSFERQMAFVEARSSASFKIFRFRLMEAIMRDISAWTFSRFSSSFCIASRAEERVRSRASQETFTHFFPCLRQVEHLRDLDGSITQERPREKQYSQGIRETSPQSSISEARRFRRLEDWADIITP
jgi:hypothetical protein